MIDFIKSLNIPLNISELLNNTYLEFNALVSEKTGEINENRYIAEHKNLKFEIITNKYVNISGSIHKYHNSGKHNYNDFNLYDLFLTIRELNERFKINPFLTPLNNVEFAVNIKTPFNPKTYIRQNIISHKGTPASVKTFKGNGYLKEFEHSQYYIKIYDKGLQFNRPDNIFRFEIKVMKMEYLQTIGINTLADLLNIEKLQNLGKNLDKVFSELLIIDKIDTKILTAKEKEIYQNGTNPMFWERLKPNSKDYENGNETPRYKKDRKKYYYELNRFKSLIKKYNLNQSQKEISKLIVNKWNNLLKIGTKKRYKLTAFLNEISNQKTEHKTVQNDHDFNSLENAKTVQNDTSNIVLICTNNKRVCKITNLDISMQKKGSKFLCISGIEFYQIYFPEIYRKLEKRLSEKWENASLGKRNIEIAHSIRNEYFNIINNTKRSINKILSIPSLFNNLNLIDNQKLKVAGMI
ncbi:MAG: hypothetical protein L3J35_09385 [Bacteroidales bacterium]|nr:hypothetical protein [Bacteroidales bacterium]